MTFIMINCMWSHTPVANSIQLCLCSTNKTVPPILNCAANVIKNAQLAGPNGLHCLMSPNQLLLMQLHSPDFCLTLYNTPMLLTLQNDMLLLPI